jgi:hypothetical protein
MISWDDDDDVFVGQVIYMLLLLTTEVHTVQVMTADKVGTYFTWTATTTPVN